MYEVCVEGRDSKENTLAKDCINTGTGREGERWWLYVITGVGCVILACIIWVVVYFCCLRKSDSESGFDIEMRESKGETQCVSFENNAYETSPVPDLPTDSLRQPTVSAETDNTLDVKF